MFTHWFEWLVIITIAVWLWRLFLGAVQAVARKRETLETIRGGETLAALQQGDGLHWIGWIIQRIQQGTLTSLADRSAAVYELERELHSIRGYDLLCEVTPKLPMVGVMLSAFLAYVSGASSVATRLLFLSGSIMALATAASVFGLILRTRLTTLERDALSWLDNEQQPGVGETTTGGGEEFRRQAFDLRQAIEGLTMAVNTMGEAGNQIHRGLGEQRLLLQSLAPLAGELRDLRTSNTSVANDARQAMSQTQELLGQASGEIRRFAAVVGQQRANLHDLEEQRGAVTRVGEQLHEALGRVSTTVGAVLGQLASGQQAFTQTLQALVGSGQELRGTLTETNRMFAEASQRMAGMEAVFDQLRTGVLDKFLPAVEQQRLAANDLRGAGADVKNAVSEINAGSHNLAQAAAALQEGNTRLTAAIGVVVDSLRRTEAVLNAGGLALTQITTSTRELTPAVERLAATVTGAERTVEHFAQVGDRMAQGVEQRLKQLDKQGVQPTIAQLLELRKLFEQLQRDLNFGGAMTDFVNSVQALWRAAQAQQEAARALSGRNRRGLVDWLFGGGKAKNGTHTENKA